MMTVKQVSDLTGVSVRTLHFYDQTGLLSPAAVTKAGYRLYGEGEIEKLRSILLFRELGFSLKEIGLIVSSPSFDRNEALRRQIELLEMSKCRTEKLIEKAKAILLKGADDMDFSAFDQTEIRNHEEEVKQRWGATEEYAEASRREKTKTPGDRRGEETEMMRIFARFGEIKQGSPVSEQAAALVKELQDFISGHYYPCTDVILRSLGEMYVSDERFKANIDEAGGEGTAEFVQRAIEEQGHPLECLH